MISVAIIGRINVGKSTLFNKLSEKRSAMVSNIPGTTRDLKYAEISWQGTTFELIDTGGFLTEQKTPLKNLTKKEQKKVKHQAMGDIDKQVEQQARKALKKSEIILLIVDAQEGINPQDRQIADYLRKEKDKQVILVINKCDNPKIRQQVAEFYKLGLGEPVLVSAVNGSGTGDLLDIIINKLKDKKTISENQLPSAEIRVSILGKPNVGKSSLLNILTGEEKAIVSPIPHTTREPNDTLIEYSHRQILLIDTAGIRRKAKVVKKSLESLGVSLSIKALRRSDISLLLLDISQPISNQDLQLGKLIVDSGVGVLLVANKYDLIKTKKLNNLATEQQNKDLAKKYTEYIYKQFPHLSWASVVFVSAKTGWNTQKILKLILEVDTNNKIKIPESALSRFLKSIIKKQPPPRKRIGFGSKTKIKRSFITNFKQIEIKPPLFECTIGTKEKLPESYRQYVLNGLRAKFGFKGVPIKLVVRYKEAGTKKL